MKQQWKAPPDWPQPEPGWTPPEGWQPDPTWGPAPEGWQFWQDPAPTTQWYRKRWVAPVAAGLAGLAIGAGAASGEDVPLATLAAAEERVESLEAELATAKEVAAAAKVKAEADLQGRSDVLAATEAALLEREKAVGLVEQEIAANSFGVGTHIVGDDIQPGTYKSAGGQGCYWERNDVSGGIIANDLTDGPAVIVVKASDFSVSVNGCADFVLSK